MFPLIFFKNSSHLSNCRRYSQFTDLRCFALRHNVDECDKSCEIPRTHRSLTRLRRRPSIYFDIGQKMAVTRPREQEIRILRHPFISDSRANDTTRSEPSWNVTSTVFFPFIRDSQAYDNTKRLEPSWNVTATLFFSFIRDSQAYNDTKRSEPLWKVTR